MSGKRRAERLTPDRRSWVVGLLALTGVFLAVVVALKVTVDRNEVAARPAASTPSASSSPTTPSPSPPPTPAPSASAAPTPSPTPTPALAKAQPAPARRIVVGDVVDTGFDEAVTPAEDHLVPISPDEVARWAERGLPGNPATDTVVVVGSVREDQPTVAFARLEEAEKGDAVEVTTDEATLTYTVDSVQRRPVADQVDDRLLARNPGRLVLIGARYDGNGDRLTDDVFVVATLSGVVPS
jgi:hypothetical protein